MYSDEEEIDEEAEFLQHMQQGTVGEDSEEGASDIDEDLDLDSDNNNNDEVPTAESESESESGSVSASASEDNGELEGRNNDDDDDDDEEDGEESESAPVSNTRPAKAASVSTSEEPRELEQWELEMQDALGSDTRNRYFGDEEPGKKCPFCRKPGHHPKDCKEKETECLLCNKDHDPIKCPLSDLCFNCSRLGHKKTECTNSSKQRYCDSCNSQTHSVYDCPYTFRKYILKPSFQMTQQALASIRKFCYNCAADDHFGDDCKERQAGNGYGYRMAVSAFNLYSLPEVPKGNTTSRNAKNRDDREFSNGYDNYDTKKDGKRKRSASGRDKYYDRDAAEPDNRRKSTGGGGGGGWNSKGSSQQQYNQPASGAYDDRRKSTGSNYHNQGNNRSQNDVADRWDGGRNNGNRRDSSVGPNRNNKTADRWDGGRGAGRPNYPPIDKNANRGKR